MATKTRNYFIIIIIVEHDRQSSSTCITIGTNTHANTIANFTITTNIRVK